jgi:phosphatidylglycerol:prolipoprotein diacylglycerol transferase
MDPVLVEIPTPWGYIPIRYYGLMYVIAIIVGIFLTRREVQRKGMHLTLDDILDFVLLTIPIAIVGARLYYVAFQWDSFYMPGDFLKTLVNLPQGLGNCEASPNGGGIIAIWCGGLAIHGGLIGGALALWIYTKWKKVAFWKFADAAAPSLVLGQAFGRFGNFMNGDAYGTRADDLPDWLSWVGVTYAEGTPGWREFGAIPTHPTMLYEMAGDLIIFGLIWFWLRRSDFRDGFILSLYFVLYSLLRFFVESLRADALCLLGGKICLQEGVGFFESLRVAQLISAVLFIVFFVFILRRRLYSAT